MTCPECGGPLDPDVTHTEHDSTECGAEWCDCPEVCAACCADPDCALREPQETHTSSCGLGPNHPGECQP